MRAPVIAALLAVLVAHAGGEPRVHAPQSSSSSSGSYRIIVNPANPATSLERRFLIDAFLKKTTRWPNGEVIRPVDLGPSSPVRRAFSEEVVGRTVQSVKTYWQQAIFSGRDVPPPELDDDDDVVRFVLKHPTAIGYVSTAAHLEGAKPVSVQ